MTLPRREFLQRVAAGALGLAAGELIAAEPVEAKEKAVSPELRGLLNQVQANYELQAPGLTENQVPNVPVFGAKDEDIITVANAALAESGPKSSVYPRIVRGGVYTPERQDVARTSAWLKAFGTTDEGSVFSFPGNDQESGAWFFPLTETTNDPDQIATGTIQETKFIKGKTEQKTGAVQQLDTLMAVNLAQLDNVGVRSLPKVAGQLSFVLADGETRGSVVVGFSMNPNFIENMTGGDPDSVPAVIVQGMPGAPVAVEYFDNTGESISTRSAHIEATNGTVSIEVPADGGFVTIGVPMRGDSDNANTELMMRMGTQPKADIPEKNYVSAPVAKSQQ
ncbi:hypothetical protein KA012_02265 [Candidatus Woesebacteria bacterium]|nr:hypothetical protein [Candidatus Woesebacteria bacterium]